MARVFRQSEVRAFMSCPREWSLKYHRGLRKKPSESTERSIRDVGTLYHAGQEAHYLGGNWRTAFPDGPPSKEDKDAFLAYRMLEGYEEWLAETGSDAGWEIEGVERELEIPFGSIHGEDVIIAGRVDLEVMDSWGLPKLVDNKSVQNFDQANLLYLDFQGRTYSLARREEGRPVQGFIHNQARRVLRTGTAKPPYYNRVEVFFNDAVLDAHERHLRSVLEQMVLRAQGIEEGEDHHLLVPPSPSRDCGWRCDFVAACAMMDDSSDVEGYLSEFYEVPVVLSR